MDDAIAPRHTVLIVDDDPDFVAQYSLALSEDGFVVITAGDRREAVRLVDERSPDAVVLDLMMEREDDGFVLAYEIKKKQPGMPVIMVTGVTGKTGMSFESVTREEKDWIKADTVFTKPVRPEQLAREIRRLLGI